MHLIYRGSGTMPCSGFGIDGIGRRDWVVTTFVCGIASPKTTERHADAFEHTMLAHCVLRVYRAGWLIKTLRRQVRRDYLFVSPQQQDHESTHIRSSSSWRSPAGRRLHLPCRCQFIRSDLRLGAVKPRPVRPAVSATTSTYGNPLAPLRAWQRRRCYSQKVSPEMKNIPGDGV